MFVAIPLTWFGVFLLERRGLGFTVRLASAMLLVSGWARYFLR
jgi:hypothetical protein